jgi:hypothetical protein
MYPQSAASQGTCLDSLLFHCFHFKLTFESIKELGSALTMINRSKEGNAHVDGSRSKEKDKCHHCQQIKRRKQMSL